MKCSSSSCTAGVFGDPPVGVFALVKFDGVEATHFAGHGGGCRCGQLALKERRETERVKAEAATVRERLTKRCEAEHLKRDAATVRKAARHTERRDAERLKKEAASLREADRLKKKAALVQH